MRETNIDIDLMVKQVREGDDRAFSQLFRYYHRDLLYFSYGLTNDLPEAEEIVSNTFAKLWKLRGGFDKPAAVKAFLYVTCRNECYDYLRFKSSGKGRLETKVEDWNDLAANVEPDKPLQFEMIYIDMLNHLHKEIEGLPPRLRQVTNKYFIEGLSTRQIADELGLTEQSIRNAKSLAIKQLQGNSFLKKMLQAILTLFIHFHH